MNTRLNPFSPDLTKDVLWDVIVVGTGMGGSTTGYELARNGRSVLFIEKGKFLFGNTDRGDGSRNIDASDDSDSRLNRGCWPYSIAGITTFGEVDFFPPLGCGTGGSTSLFAAQLERMLPCDFEPRCNYRRPSIFRKSCDS
jgi:choline dehydrogenase-like flavoprotein